MVKYELEIVTRKGNKFRDGGKTLMETRIKACRYAKNEDATVNIRQQEMYTSRDYPGMKFRNWVQIETIFYDPKPNRPGSYTTFNPGFYLDRKYHGKKVRSRVSPKTGRPLDVNKEWRFL